MTQCAAVAIGNRLPWHNEDLADLLDLLHRRGCVLVPVRLPGSGPAPTLPRNLAWRPWVEFGEGIAEALVQASEPVAGTGPVLGESFTEPLTGARFLWIPGGRFWIGGDRYAWEGPRHDVRVSPFWLTETPVTNRQYAVYLDATENEEPSFWRDRRFSAPEQPVVGVSWHDACAFCHWLADAMGMMVELPTEAQWEFAARGCECRQYPWGDEAPSAERVCFNQDWRKGHPAPAGSFPEGRGPYGTLDQAGNVWEWCRDAWDDSAYVRRAEAGTVDNPVEEGSQASDRVLRGGSWCGPVEALQAAGRVRFWASVRDNAIGFRLSAVLLPP
ncbi:MAG: formylglycine-generating enzyme family protein [bacterium]|nr:formylglycine-generating enzyme family protein [bacterium]